jgi:osmotically-inducible protein OsmY
MKTNEELRNDVMEEIKWDPQLKNVSSQIGVTNNEGVITLTGIVDTYNKKLAAEKAAQRVAGVKVVASEIEVKIGMLGKKTDTEIAEAIKNALKWNTAVSEDLIEIKVDNGWVFLDGIVDWEYERMAAQRSVEELQGVRGVTNNIAIKSKAINTKEIKQKIAAAFHRSATVDSSSIWIETVGTKAILHGKVKSWAEKKESENIAWSSPGVMSVENKIDIDVEVFA